MTQAIFLNANLPASGRLTANSYRELSTNIGNAYIAYSLFKILGLDAGTTVIENTIWKRSPNLRRLALASESCPWVFVNLQDQLRTSFPDEEYEAAIEILNALNPKARMVAFSLSANAMRGPDLNLAKHLSPVRRRFFDLLAARCLSIGVRGPYTAEILRCMGITNVGVVGCPSYFEHGQQRTVETPHQRGAIAGVGGTGSFKLPPSCRQEVYLQGDMDWPWISLLHADTEMWRQQDKNDAALADPRLQQAAIEGRLHFFTDFPAWQKHIAANCRVVCGSRLHGAIMALNAGVPAIVTNPDARAQDACEFFGIPWRPEFLRQAPTVEMLLKAADPTKINALYEERRNNFERWLDGVGLRPLNAREAPALTPYAKNPPVVVSLRVAEITKSNGLARRLLLAIRWRIGCVLLGLRVARVVRFPRR